MSALELQTQLSDDIQSLIRPKDKLVLEAGDKEQFEKSYLTSNFNGKPYFEKDEKWPINLQTRKPLDFVFQFVNDGSLLFPSNIKVLQFYYDWDTPPVTWKQNGWLIKVYHEIQEEKYLATNNGIHKPFHTVRFTRDYSLPTWESLDYYRPEIVSLCKQTDPINPWDVYEQNVNQLIGQKEITSFIGSYPQWIQGDVTPTFGSYRSKLLVQIDSEESAELNWGNMGSLYLFYHPLKIYDFEFIVQSL